jgi:hypothetical protein
MYIPMEFCKLRLIYSSITHYVLKRVYPSCVMGIDSPFNISYIMEVKEDFLGYNGVCCNYFCD